MSAWVGNTKRPPVLKAGRAGGAAGAPEGYRWYWEPRSAHCRLWAQDTAGHPVWGVPSPLGKGGGSRFRAGLFSCRTVVSPALRNLESS